jgi:hypothetical protein
MPVYSYKQYFHSLYGKTNHEEVKKITYRIPVNPYTNDLWSVTEECRLINTRRVKLMAFPVSRLEASSNVLL